MAVAQGISARELLVFLYRYRRRLIFAFTVPFVLAVVGSFIPAPKYVATSVLIVRLGSEYVYQPEVGISQGENSQPLPFTSDEIFKAEVAILESDDLHEQVIREIGIENIYPDLFKPNVLTPVKNVIDNAMASLGLTDSSTPEGRDRYMHALAVQIFDKHYDVLLEKESAVIDLSFQHKDPAVAVKALDTLLKLYLEKREKLYLEPRVATARSQAEVTHQKAIAAEQALEDFKRKHNIHSYAEERTALLTERGEVEKQRAMITSSELDDKMGYFDHRLEQMDALEQQESTLENDAKVASDEYALFQHKLDEAVAFEEMEHQRVSSVRIIQPPIAPAEPKSIQFLIILVGFVFSFLSMLAVAVATEYSNNSFMTPERLERNLGLRVLAVLPYFE